MNRKKGAALVSLYAAIALTVGKAVVGFATGSLGILSEAAHSGLDFLATAMTLFAVLKAAKPPDEEHPYGHGKIENLSALFETLLLVLTCVWIIYEAVSRLTSEAHEIEVNFWSYFVVVTAIIVDIWRSRALSRAAKETNSPALEADAFHFSSDIGSSLVVLVGLVSYQLGFKQADSIAALVVAIIVLYICYKLGMKAIEVLIDRVPSGAREKAKASALSVEGVSEAYDIKVREAGDAQFVEMKIKLDAGLPFGEVHRITSLVEDTVRGSFTNARVIIHPEPGNGSMGGIYEDSLRLSEAAGARLHDFTVFETDHGIEVALHTEWPPGTVFQEAWRKAGEIEKILEEQYPQVKSLFIHFEPTVERLGSSIDRGEGDVKRDVAKKLKTLDPPLSRSKVRIIESEGVTHIHLTFPAEGSLTVEEVHMLSTKLENAVVQVAPEKSHTLSQAVPLDQFEKYV